MSDLVLGPFRAFTALGDADDLASGRLRVDALADLDERLPRPNSLRRAGDEPKMAVRAAAAVFADAEFVPGEGTALYVGQQQGGFDFCARFIEASVREGPRLASPMLFAESVANNTATHLSLTLGLKGAVQTFIGTRVAGIQAVAAAREDLETGSAETALVVVVGTSTGVTRDAYAAVLNPKERRQRRDPLRHLRGAAAFLLRRGGAGLPLRYAGVRCEGRRRAGPALAALWKESGGGRLLVSGHSLAPGPVRDAVRFAVGTDVPARPSYGECFALDPFLQLILDAREGPGRRAVACVSDEGTAGLLVAG